MGLPEIIVEFKNKASSFVYRSGHGIVVLILKDDTQSDFTRKAYTSADDDGISETNWSEKNIDYIKKAFLGEPATVICERIATDADSDDLASALAGLQTTKFSYLAMPKLPQQKLLP